MERDKGFEIRDQLSNAKSKMDFLTWVISAAASSGELMGADQLSGLYYVMRDIREVMTEAEQCTFSLEKPEEAISKHLTRVELGVRAQG